ncbi:hypothetical protein LINPERHAP1_LOCUS5169 [Linum perenne]
MCLLSRPLVLAEESWIHSGTH